MNVRVALKTFRLIIFMGFPFFLASAISCKSAFCAETLRYNDAISDALNNSARIRVKVEDINISDAAYRQNFASLYPEISINSRFERYENLDKRPDQKLSTISGEVISNGASAWRSSIYLWGQYYFSHFYKKRFEANYYEKMRDVRVHECSMEVKKLLRDATDAFGAASEGKIKLRYANEILGRLKSMLGLKAQAFTKGQASYEDVLKAEAAVADMEKEYAVLRKEFRENLERLCSYTGKTYDDEIEVEGLVLNGRKDIADVRLAIETTPEYKARMFELEANKLKAKAANNNLWPDVSLYGRYDYYGSNTNGMDNAFSDIRETSYAAGILINIPLFDGGVRSWERKKNMYEVRRQEENVKAVIEEKARDIKALSAGYRELSKSLKHSRNLLDRYEKMLEITRKATGLGERSMMDIMEMEKESLGIERDLKVTEQSMAAYEKRLVLETDFYNFLTGYYGHGACKY